MRKRLHSLRVVFGLAAIVLGLAPTLCVAADASQAGGRTLSFDERVAAQKAIEQVYWNHRIWPKDNPGPKPPLSAVMPDSAIRAKVEAALQASALLDSFWHQPLTGEQLQAEVDRIARQTKAPETLHDLFAALHDDPFLIAECLARPILAQRMVESAFANDERIHGSQRAMLATKLSGVRDLAALERLEGDHAEMTLVLDDGLEADTAPPDRGIHDVHVTSEDWKPEVEKLAAGFDLSRRPRPELPIDRVSKLLDRDGRFVAFAVRAKSATRITIVSVSWPKRDYGAWAVEALGDSLPDPGAIAPPAQGYVAPEVPLVGCTNDTWTPTRAPDERFQHTAIWTGAEMIVWGGSNNGEYLDTGGRYNPSTDSWAASSLTTGSGANAPVSRELHTAVWTGTEMIVWGGGNAAGYLNTGGRYNPATDTWAASSLTTGAGANVPAARRTHTAVWTGSEMVVWGGYYYDGTDHYVNTGGRYNPSTDTWAASSLTTGAGANVPIGRVYHTAVWTGAEMIVVGGDYYDGSYHYPNTGGRYDPVADTWALSSLTTGSGANVPSGRDHHTAVWSNARGEMIVWGGHTYDGTNHFMNDGGEYKPSTDTWAASSLVTGSGVNVPASRDYHTAVWSPERGEMIVWGGQDASGALQTGGRYNPSTDTWATSALTTGSGANVPAGRLIHTAVWTGTEMVVWGGTSVEFSGKGLGTGGRYNPSTDSWATSSLPAGSGANVPAASNLHSAIWTGSEMIVWGGDNGGFYLATGSRYDPSTDSWVGSSLNTGAGANRPPPSDSHSAIWTGTEMIIWGGVGSQYFSVGGRYNPTTDSWTPSSLTTGAGANVPAARELHTAVWTGTEMIVWGGYNGAYLNTGGRYNPSTDTWAASSLTLGTGVNTPVQRDYHTAVWSVERGEMIVWGGFYNDGTDHYLNTGGRYDLVTDSWATSSLTAGTGANVPSVTFRHTAVWTGTEMIVWGGKYFDGANHYLRTGGRYNPSTDAWAASSLTTGSGTNVPGVRDDHTAVWTGSEMVVWGGLFRLPDGTAQYLNTGGRYNPSTDLWTASSLTNGSGASVPVPRESHTSVWTGSRMIVWGGSGGDRGRVHTGGVYCACPGGRLVYQDADGDGYGNAAVVSTTCDGSIPAGYVVDDTDCNDANAAIHPGAPESCNGVDNNCNGLLYEGLSNLTGWGGTRLTGAPSARSGHVGVSAGSLAIVWGGTDGAVLTNTGGRYDPSADAWTSMSTTGAPSARKDATAVWTGTQMIVWGGQDSGGASRNGAQYQPSNDTWSNVSTSGQSGGSTFSRSLHTAVWTGSSDHRMIVWGGKDSGGVALDTGGLWDQAGNNWSPVTSSGAPSARFNHTAVWTGTKMIVWGGEHHAGTVFGDGALYDRSANTWSAMSSIGAPSARTKHTAVWTGTKMIVWGGGNNTGTFYADGAAYDPASNTWTPLPSSGAPSGRRAHSAVWDPTDGLMIVWGGMTTSGTVFNDGASYNPSTNSWTALSSTNAPAGRSGQLGLWVASLPGMVVWGGDGSASTENTGGRYVLTSSNCGVGACARQSVFVCNVGPGTYTYACTPGTPSAELCNGIDDNCDGGIDNGIVPPGVLTTLTMTKQAGGSANLSWSALGTAQNYDAVRGSLNTLRSSAGNFTSSTSLCVVNNTAASPVTDPSVPTVGTAYWYLVRGGNCAGAGSYDESVPSQSGSRDAEIAASPNACP